MFSSLEFVCCGMSTVLCAKHANKPAMCASYRRDNVAFKPGLYVSCESPRGQENLFTIYVDGCFNTHTVFLILIE
jgi:hypothetical protein